MLLPRAGHLDEAQRVQLFTGGLLPPLSLDVQVHNAQSLAAAMSLARQLELWEQYVGAPAKAPARGLLPAPPPRLALTAPPAAKADAPGAAIADRPAAKRLSTQEQEERRRLGLCFNCNERYTRGHNRVCKRIFFLGGVDLAGTDEAGDDEARETETLVFSLHAVAGVPLGQTIQLRVLLAAASFIALVDTGSTHSFIGEEAAQRTGLPIERAPLYDGDRGERRARSVPRRDLPGPCSHRRLGVLRRPLRDALGRI